MGDITDYERFTSQLKTCILNSRLYPPGSPVVQTGYDDLYAAFQPCVADEVEITVNDIEGKIYINEKILLLRAELHPFMFPHDVQTLAFDQETTREELGDLVEGLGKRKSDLGEGVTLTLWLTERGCTHIRVEEFQFIAVKKGDDIARQVRLLFNQKYDSFASVLKSMENTLQLMQATEDVAVRDSIQVQMVDQIAHLSPALLRDFFEQPLTADLQNLPIRQQVLASLSVETMTRFITEVPTWVAQLRRESFSATVRLEREARLKQTLLMLRQAPAASAIAESVFRGALAAFEDDSLLAQLSPSDQVQRRLTQEPSALLLPFLAQTWTPLINGLCLMKAYTSLSPLALHLAKNLNALDAHERLGAAKLLRSIYETAAANRAEEHLDGALDVLSQKLDVEVDAGVFSQMTQTLQVAASTELARGNNARCLYWVERLRLFTNPTTSPTEGHRHEAAKALTIFTQRAMEIIVADTFSMNPQTQATAGQVLAAIGGPAAAALVAFIQRTADPRLRQFAIQSLRRYPQETRQALLFQLEQRQTPETLFRLLPLVALCPDPTLIAPLAAIIKSSDANLRKEALRVLATIKDDEAHAAVAEVEQLLDHGPK